MTRVGVVIPAYNAAATIDETLFSVRAQTWRDLDIVVVDDGSNDDTSTLVRNHMREDRRVRLVQSTNGGVARARNTGIEEVKADLIACVDADDLWHSRKVELQLDAFEQAKGKPGLVYCWFVVIDELNRIIRYGNRDKARGNVLRRMCLGNLIGSGSSALFTRSAVEGVGGFDPGLRDQGAQGCEDLKLYFALAESHDFAVVPQYLVGYRATPASMSSDGDRMLRSYDLVMGPARDRYPQHTDQFSRGRVFLTQWLLERAVSYGSPEQAKAMFRELYRQSRLSAVRTLPRNATLLRRRFISRAPNRHFADLAMVNLLVKDE